MRGALQPWHILILVVVVVIVFGWKRLPDAARSLGRSMRIFKSEVDEMKQDGKSTPSAASGDTVKGDTVKGEGARSETFDPTTDPADRHTTDPTAAPDAAERKTHNQPPV